MSREDRQAAEFLARQVRDLMDMGTPRNVPFDAWLADYFMRFLAERARAQPMAPPPGTAAQQAQKIVSEWAAVPLNDVGFTLDGAWTYGNLVARIAEALAEARRLALEEAAGIARKAVDDADPGVSGFDQGFIEACCHLEQEIRALLPPPGGTTCTIMCSAAGHVGEGDGQDCVGLKASA